MSTLGVCLRCSRGQNDCECLEPEYAQPEVELTEEMALIDYLPGLYYAVSIAGEATVLTKADEARKRRIMSRSLRIADYIMREINLEFFPNASDEGDE